MPVGRRGSRWKTAIHARRQTGMAGSLLLLSHDSLYPVTYRSPLHLSSFPSTMRLQPQIFLLFFLNASRLPCEADVPLGCSNATSRYTSNSTYDLNLKTLLLSLSSCRVASADGFCNGTVGNSSDQVHGLIQCRGDIPPETCARCTSDGISKVFKMCSGGKSFTFWTGNCMIRYSNTNFFGVVDDGPATELYSVHNVPNVASYNRQLGSLMYNLSSTATTLDNKRLFSVGDIMYTDVLKIYGLVQCTMDLSADDCYRCLSRLISFVGKGPMKGKTIGWVVTQSCFLGFKDWRFYSTSSLLPSPPPAAQNAVISSPPSPSIQGSYLYLAFFIYSART